MKARGAAVLASVAMILLMAFASYLLDIPLEVVLIGAAFAIGVILWVASRAPRGAARSFQAERTSNTELHTNSRPNAPSFPQNEGFSAAPLPENPPGAPEKTPDNRE